MSNRPTLQQKPWDAMHITKAPWKRDEAAVCPTSYSSCPASLNGGCCPTDRSCGPDNSCYVTTAAPASACSKSGYIACGINQGGGCCPGGYSCANDGCIPLSGATDTQTCGIDSISCAASLGGGCCKNKYACGANGICYQTSFSSVSLTQTITTTDSNAHTIIITTTYQTAYRETYTPLPSTASPSAAIAKVTTEPTTVPKVEPSSSRGGLTSGQLGGIIAAAVTILIAVIIAAFLIIRRLNAVVKIQKSSGSGAKGKSGSGTNTRSSDRHKARHPQSSAGDFEYDTLSIDPLMMATDNSTTSSRHAGVSRPSAVHNNSSELDANSPPPLGSPPNSKFHGSTTGGYQQVPPTESNYFDTHTPSNHRSTQNHSIDSDGQSNSPNVSPYIGYDGGSYFDPLDPAFRDQNLRFGHPPVRPLQHGRQWSDASDVSAQSFGSGEVHTPPIELEGDTVDGRHGSVSSVGTMASVMQRMGLSRSTQRVSQEGRTRRSSGATATGNVIGSARRMSGQQATGVYQSQSHRLDRVQEASRSNIALETMPMVAKPKDEVLIREQEVIPVHPSQQQQQTPVATKGLGIEVAPPLERELQRLDGQKFAGNIQDFLGRGER